MKTINLKVSGMMCGGCEKRLQKALTSMTGIKDVNADHKTGTVIIFAENDVDETAVKAKIEDIGFLAES